MAARQATRTWSRRDAARCSIVTACPARTASYISPTLKIICVRALRMSAAASPIVARVWESVAWATPMALTRPFWYSIACFSTPSAMPTRPADTAQGNMVDQGSR